MPLPSTLPWYHFLSIGGTAYLTSKNKGLWQRIPTPITLCWLVSIVSYLFYITRQKSVLNTWPKPNEFSDLLTCYNESLQILTILVPILAYLLTTKSNTDAGSLSIEEIGPSRKIIITSVLWFSDAIYILDNIPHFFSKPFL